MFFNEIEPFCQGWLNNLFPGATIDGRDIRELRPADVVGHDRCHFFAGVGGWEYALQLAGWEGPVWTASLPCQPFSTAGKRQGFEDERHLWPVFFDLVKECRPATLFGEQVPGAIRLGWLDRVFDDLEGEDYACGSLVLPACSVGAPHIRARLFWVAHSEGERCGETWTGGGRSKERQQRAGLADRLEHATGDGRDERRAESNGRGTASGCGSGGLGDTTGERHGGWQSNAPQQQAEVLREGYSDISQQASTVIPCRDGKSRRISAEPGDEPLAHGLPRDVGPLLARLGAMGTDPRNAKRLIALARANRVGRLKGYGNSISPQVAATFIRAFMETQHGR